MKFHVVEGLAKYNGSQLHSLFAYTNYGIMGDSIIVFRGPCVVEKEEMVDLEDVLAEDWIYSEDMLHLIIEHFDMDLEKAVIRQRLLIATIKELLEQHGINSISRSGDDLFQGEKKLSVSIATLSPVSTLIHCGLNISSKNTPIKTVSLSDLGISNFLQFGQIIADSYCKEVASMRLARCKVRGVN